MENQKPEALILVNDRPSAIGDDLYQWALDAEDMIRRLHARNQELEAMLDAVGAGGVSAQRVTQGKDHVAQPRKMVAAPVVLPEPDEYQYRMKGNWDDKLPWTAWEACSKESAAIFRKLKEVHNWIYEVRERYTEQQVRELLDKADCTKSQTTAQEPFGYFKSEPFGWRDCAETDEGAIALYTAPQPQADARDAERYLDYLIHNQARVRNNLDEYEGEEEDADCGYWLEFTDSHSQRWVQIGIFKTPRDAIDAAIAAEKEHK